MMIEDFLNYLRYERNRSDLTVLRYGQSLRDFETFFKNRDSQLSWESVDSDVIRDWMESMMDNAICPSHYMGAFEMYRMTGNKKYMEFGLDYDLHHS